MAGMKETAHGGRQGGRKMRRNSIKVLATASECKELESRTKFS